MVVYISGPMTGLPNYNREAFFAAQKKLEADGHTVLNPAWMPDGLEDWEYFNIDFAMLGACDAIYMLKGWEKSNGAKKELGYAKIAGIKVLFEEGAVEIGGDK